MSPGANALVVRRRALFHAIRPARRHAPQTKQQRIALGHQRLHGVEALCVLERGRVALRIVRLDGGQNAETQPSSCAVGSTVVAERGELLEPRVDSRGACGGRLPRRAAAAAPPSRAARRRDSRRAGSARAESSAVSSSMSQPFGLQLRVQRAPHLRVPVEAPTDLVRQRPTGQLRLRPHRREQRIDVRADQRVPGVFHLDAAHFEVRQLRQHAEVLDARRLARRHGR